MLGLDAVERRERAAKDVVQPAILVRPLDGDQVDRLLDNANDRPVAPGVLADRAELLLGQVPALLAEADALLHFLNGGGERVSCATRLSIAGETTGQFCLCGWLSRPR